MTDHESHELNQLERGRKLTEAEIACYLADHQTALRHGTAHVGDEIAEQLRDRLRDVNAATFRPTAQLDVEATIIGNAELHGLERIAFAQRALADPEVAIWCLCGRVYQWNEYTGHIGSVVSRALAEAGVPRLLSVAAS